MIWLALVAASNSALAAFLVYENRKLTYAAIARHAGEIAVIERAPRRRSKPADSDGEKTYHSWRNPVEGVGP